MGCLVQIRVARVHLSIGSSSSVCVCDWVQWIRVLTLFFYLNVYFLLLVVKIAFIHFISLTWFLLLCRQFYYFFAFNSPSRRFFRSASFVVFVSCFFLLYAILLNETPKFSFYCLFAKNKRSFNCFNFLS